jgi:bisphosphoglycerate-dependent phosphoglycerate mutase
MITVSDRKRSKSPRTQKIRKITLLWIPSHVGITGNETADEVVKEVKEALDEEIQHNEKYPPQDLLKWMKNKHQEQKQKKWERSTATTKERKPFFQKNINTKTMNRREHVVVSRDGNTRATNTLLMNKD